MDQFELLLRKERARKGRMLKQKQRLLVLQSDTFAAIVSREGLMAFGDDQVDRYGFACIDFNHL
ncbi:MAG: hypothetical protein CL862_10405 [Cyanobium sp. NAT70]|nr:hypothetical protein [Cyanobium sp. NAT70]